MSDELKQFLEKFSKYPDKALMHADSWEYFIEGGLNEIKNSGDKFTYNSFNICKGE